MRYVVASVPVIAILLNYILTRFHLQRQDVETEKIQVNVDGRLDQAMDEVKMLQALLAPLAPPGSKLAKELAARTLDLAGTVEPIPSAASAAPSRASRAVKRIPK